MQEKDSLLQQLEREKLMRSEIEDLAEKYKKAKDAAEQVSKAKSEFLTNMSYGLRTPLETIIGYTEMIQEKMNAEEQAKYSAHLDNTLQSAHYLVGLVDNVVDLSKIETEKMELFLEDFNLDELVSTLNSQVEPLFKKRKNTLKITVDSEFNTMHSDSQRVQQVLLNLLTNANRFTEKGNITFDITSLLQGKEPVLQFVVSDTGVGMTAEQLGRLFHQFSQTNTSPEITGLGLYVTKQFCELLGGRLLVQSKEGHGSVFTIILPLRSDLAKAHSEKHHSRFAGKTVLIISSESKDTCAEINRSIQNAGFGVLYANNGHEGLALAHQHRPDVIVLDISTASFDDSLMDKWTILSDLKADLSLSHIPVLVTTQNVEKSLSTKSKNVDFLDKPVDIKLLINKVKRLMPVGIPSLLIVDDDGTSRELLVRVIKKAGWTAIEAQNGQEALQKLKESIPTLILLDLLMPDMDGFSLINELQKNEQWRNIPVIIVSAKTLSEEERVVLGKYSEGILHKTNYTSEGLVKTITEQLMGDEK